MKRTLLIFLAIVLVSAIPFSTNGTARAISNFYDPSEINNYAYDIVYKHLNSQGLEYLDYIISEPFSLVNIVNDFEIYCYLVQLENGEAKILQVAENDNKLTSSLSNYFVDEIIKIKKRGDFSYQLFTDGNHVFKTDGRSFDVIFSLDKEEESIVNFSEEFYSSDIKDLSALSEMPQTKMAFNKFTARRYYYTPPKSKDLYVRGIKQEYSAWCWAACAAMGINYGTRDYVTQKDVVRAVNNGNLVYRGGSMYDIVNAYGQWGLNPFIASRLDFRTVMDEIDRDRPLILALKMNGSGHMLLVKGYEDWYGTSWSDDQIINFIDPTYGNEISIVHVNAYELFYRSDYRKCEGLILQ